MISCGEQESIGQEPMIKKVKVEPKPPLNVKWKATIEAKVDPLVVEMAKVKSLVESMGEIKAMLQSKQH